MNLVGSENRMDVPRGNVPDYRTFVRHLWSYQDGGLSPVSPPPTMYRILFPETDEQFEGVMAIARRTVQEHALEAWQLTWEEIPIDGESSWEFKFQNIEAIHAFCIQLASAYREDDTDAVSHLGEFIMWTLGFRWV